MPVPSAITDLSTTASSNSPAGSESSIEGDNHLRAAYSFIAQLNANKLDKAGTVTPTANQPMGTYKFTGAGNATASGQFLVWGQDGNLASLRTTQGAIGKGGFLSGSGTITTAIPYGASAVTGGGLLIITGADNGGQSFCAVYAVTTSLPSATDSVTASLIVRQGASTPSLTVAGSGGFVIVTVGATGANLTYVFGVGF